MREPPSMPSVWPVMYPACFEQRNAHAAPNSAGSPNRPIGAAADCCLIRSSGSTPAAMARPRVRSVRMASGARQLTVMRSGASSRESVFARPVTAARIAFDSAMLGIGWRTEIEVMHTMRPCSERFRRGSAARINRTALMSVNWKATSHISSGVLWKVPGGGPPALTTSTSRPDSRVVAALTSASVSSARETSAGDQPAAPISFAVRSMATESRDEMNTSAPSAISASAHARPNPLLAAVTSALRPFSPRSIASLLPLAARVDVPLRHVLEAILRLDDVVHAHAMHPLRDRVVVVRRIKKDRGRRIGHLGLEVKVSRQAGGLVDCCKPVLEILVYQTPPARVREVEGAGGGARVPHRVQVRVGAHVDADERRLIVVVDQVFLHQVRDLVVRKGAGCHQLELERLSTLGAELGAGHKHPSSGVERLRRGHRIEWMAFGDRRRVRPVPRWDWARVRVAATGEHLGEHALPVDRLRQGQADLVVTEEGLAYAGRVERHE